MTRTRSGSRSYAGLLDELRLALGSVAIFREAEIISLLSPLSCDTDLAARVLGEGLTRLWLDNDCASPEFADSLRQHAGPALWSCFQDVLGPARRSSLSDINWQDIMSTDWTEDDLQRKAWTWAVTRCRNYREADGLIAVVGGRQDSLAIPFRLSRDKGEPGMVRDLTGRTIGTWSAALNYLHDCFPAGIPRVMLLCECGARAELLEGESLALAICVAEARRDGRLGDFDPLSVLCTGAFDASGHLDSVQAIPVKQRLAENMGVQLFVFPGTESRSQPGVTIQADRLAIPPGTPARECIDRIAQHLDALGMDSLNARQANQRIRELQTEIHGGLLPLELAVRRLDRYEVVFHGEPGSEFADEGMMYVNMLRGAMANHAGNPETGRVHLRRAAQLAQQSKNPLVQMHAIGNMIVSLTDLGLLDEAENEARDLRKWVGTEFHGNTEEKIEARMVAAGVLGGQPLLQKAMADPSLAAESLELLRQALDNARQLQQNPEIARDASQIALWYALLDPVNAPAQIEIAQREIRACGKDGDVSEQFLCNYRFLAAYRVILGQCPRNPEITEALARHLLVGTALRAVRGRFGETSLPGNREQKGGANAPNLHGGTTSVSSTDNLPDIFPGFTDWPLPQEIDWVLGTALKYRGCLHAVAGQADAAVADFEQASALLGPGNQVLIRFIGATAALQASDSLRLTHPAKSKDFARQARAVFDSVKDILHGPHRDPAWIARAETLANGADPRDIENPQLRYRY